MGTIRFTFSKIIIILVGLMLCTNIGISSTTPQYFLAILIGITFLLAAAVKKRCTSKVDLIDIFPVLMILVWVYGVFLGFINDNVPLFIISNFAGLSLYFLYYPLVYFQINKNTLIKLLFFAAYVNTLYAFVFAFNSDVVTAESAEDLSGSRRYYSAGLIVFLPALSLIIAHNFIEKIGARSITKDIFFIGLSLICFLYLSVSKGLLAALLFLISIYTLIFLIRNILFGKASKKGVFILFFLISACLYAVIFTSILEQLMYIFSGEEVSNSVRNEQRIYLVDEFSLFGKGLGATLESGYNRGDEAAYGFELSYENLIHKIGIFSLIPFSIFIYVLTKSFGNLIKQKNFKYSACALGAMMYLVPSYGNPMLFSPIAVMLHCIAMYFLREPHYKLGKNYVLK